MSNQMHSANQLQLRLQQHHLQLFVNLRRMVLATSLHGRMNLSQVTNVIASDLSESTARENILLIMMLTIHATMNNLTIMTSQLHPISFSQRLKFQSLNFQRLKFSSYLIKRINQKIRLQLSSSNQMMDLCTYLRAITKSYSYLQRFSSQQPHNLSFSSCCNVL